MKKNTWEYGCWRAALTFVDLRDKWPGFLPIGIFTLFLFTSGLVNAQSYLLLVVLFVFIAVLQAVQMYGYQFGTISHLTSPCMLLLSLILSVGNISHGITDISSISGGCFIPGMAQHVMPSKQGPHVSSFGANWWSPRLPKGKQQNIWKILGLDLDQWSATITFALISYWNLWPKIESMRLADCCQLKHVLLLGTERIPKIPFDSDCWHCMQTTVGNGCVWWSSSSSVAPQGLSSLFAYDAAACHI